MSSSRFARALVRWRLARDVLEWTVPAAIVTFAIILLCWGTWLVFVEGA